jgi:hypothetical protein
MNIILPDEIWEIIINFLSLEDIKKIWLNKFFFQKCKNYHYWENNNFRNLDYLNYFTRVKIFKDVKPYSKFYLEDYKNLFQNNLKSIYINIIDVLDFKILKSNKDIEELYLETYLTTEVEESFKNFKKLEKLTFFNCMIDDKILEYINLNPKLKELNFYNCEHIQNTQNIKLNRLEKFSYTNNSRIDKKNIINFLKNNKKLKSINFYNIPLDLEIISNFPDLKELYVSSCSNIFANKEIILLSDRCKNLVKLDISNLSIQDEDIKILVIKCKKIKDLNLSQNFLKDMSLIYISQFLPFIEKLNVSFTYISRIGIENLLLRCKKLKNLNILNQHFDIKYLDKINNLIKNRNG